MIELTQEQRMILNTVKEIARRGNGALTCDMYRQIEELFQGLAYSGVSKANRRFSLRMSEDRQLRKTVEKITKSMPNVKVTPLRFREGARSLE